MSRSGKVSILRYFIAGAGAIGCKMLIFFCFGMTEVGSGPDSDSMVTDMDTNEKSKFVSPVSFPEC